MLSPFTTRAVLLRGTTAARLTGTITPNACLASHSWGGIRVLTTTSAPVTSAVATPTPTSTVSTSDSATTPQTFGPDTKALVNRLRNQINYFATVRIKGRLFTVTEGDMIVTERMADLALGDVLQLDRVKEIGSRDFSIVGKPYVSPEYYTIRAVVMEHTLSSPITVVKFKKRKDYKKTIVYQHKYTLLRVSKLDVKKLE